jgi:SulP family sulfate permease
VAAGLFGGAVVGGSVQASALNVGAGSRTRWSAVFAGVVVIAVVLIAAPLVQQVPLAVTAGILIVAALSMLQLRAAREIWRADRLSAAVMAATFLLVLIIPLQYAVLAGAVISVAKYIYLSSLDVRVVEVTFCDGGHAREASGPRTVDGSRVTVLDIYGSLFFAANPKLKESLPTVGGAQRAVVVLRLRGRGTLQSATMALIRDYAAELAAGGGRLYLAGVGPQMHEQLLRTGLLQMLGTDAVVPASDEPYGACEIARRRGRLWLRAAGGQSEPGSPASVPDATLGGRP